MGLFLRCLVLLRPWRESLAVLMLFVFSMMVTSYWLVIYPMKSLAMR